MLPEILKKNTEIFVFVILTCVSFLIYSNSLNNFFIADDLINLHFIQNFKGDYSTFLFPHLRTSDLIVNGRFCPLWFYLFSLLYKMFGTDPYPYHVISIFVNSLNAFLIYCIAKKIGLNKTAAFIASLIFCTYRLNSQILLWITNYVFGLTLLLLSFLLFLSIRKDQKLTLICSVALYFLALFMSPQLIFYPLIISAYIVIFKDKLNALSLLKHKVKMLLGFGTVLAAFAICNIVSIIYFPPSDKTLLFSGYRFIAFIINLVAPYDLNDFIKILCALIAVLLILKKNNKLVAFLAISIFINALFWAFIFPNAHSQLTPRYLYPASIFFSLLLGYSFESIITHGNRIKKTIALLLFAFFLIVNISLIISHDQKWFEYLSAIGNKINNIAELDGAKKTIYIEGFCTLNNRNLAFFKDKVTFISDKNKIDKSTYIVNTEQDKYIKYFGNDFGNTYWYYPWFITEKSLKEKLTHDFPAL